MKILHTGDLHLQALEDRRWQALKSIISMCNEEHEDEFDLLFRHRFEVADYTLYAYYADDFPYIGFVNSQWYEPGSSQWE